MPLLITFSRQILIWYHSVLLISVVRSVAFLSLLIVIFYFFFQFLQFILSFPLHCDPTKWWLDVGVPFLLFLFFLISLLDFLLASVHFYWRSSRHGLPALSYQRVFFFFFPFYSICTFIHTIHSFMRILFSNVARQRQFQREKREKMFEKKRSIPLSQRHFATPTTCKFI